MGEWETGCLDVPGEGFLVGLAVVVAIVLAILFVVPLLVAVIDLLVLAIVMLLGVIARVVFRRPWTVEARAHDGTTLCWRVRGWRASGQRCDEIEASLAVGIVPTADGE